MPTAHGMKSTKTPLTVTIVLVILAFYFYLEPYVETRDQRGKTRYTVASLRCVGVLGVLKRERAKYQKACTMVDVT